jgi:hypothetical protein
MSNPTTPFGWQMPTATDLVTDLPADFEVFGQAVATSMADLLGGTSGQVLAKNSNTDMDFVWVAQDDSNAIQNAIVDAKGDLIAASANDTPARLAVGNDGETLVADSSTSTGLRYQANFAAGKNKILNSDYSIWQRGISFSGTSGIYTADRFYYSYDTTSSSVTRETFTAGTAPVAGYEGQYFMRLTRGTGGSFVSTQQRIEDVRTLSGQTATLSFWAKASATCTIEPVLQQNFGSGGSADVNHFGAATTLTTSWVRYSFTFSIGSMSGKTIGANNYLGVYAQRITSATNVDVDIWGLQLEAGSIATAFQTATGTLQGELAACQRYYYKVTNGTTNCPIMNAGYYSASSVNGYLNFPVTMRISPALDQVTGTDYYQFLRNGGTDGFNSFTIDQVCPTGVAIYNNGQVSGTAGHAGFILTNNASASLAFTSEL